MNISKVKGVWVLVLCVLARACVCGVCGVLCGSGQDLLGIFISTFHASPMNTATIRFFALPLKTIP